MDIIEVLAEPARRRILDELRRGDRTVNELVDRLGMSQPSTSKHLKVLRAAGLVSVRPDAQRRVHSLRPGRLRELDAWLEPYRLLWSGRLDALEEHLSRMGDDE
jgi:DNA-binding transcriptional ArsR family regulator